MAKARRVYRSRASKGIPVAVLAGFAPVVGEALSAYQAGMGLTGITWALSSNLTGYSLKDHKFYMNDLIRGWTPIILGFVLHRVADKMGINRALANSGIPLLRV